MGEKERKTKERSVESRETHENENKGREYLAVSGEMVGGGEEGGPVRDASTLTGFEAAR